MTIKQPAPRDIPALRQLWKEAFGDSDAFLDGFFRTGFDSARCRCTGDLTAALYWFDCTWNGKKLAYVYAVATAEAYRGRGLCRMLMEDTHRHLQRLGYAGAVLVPGDAGLFRLYEKLGYRPFCPRRLVTVAAAETPTGFCPMTPEKYAAARKQLLPADAVWQEGATLAYLETFAGFYGGDGFAFCGSVEDKTLYFQEFIGDVEKATGIVAVFNCDSGVIPVFGGDAPYAMYRSLDGDSTLPQYFCIPLD